VITGAEASELAAHDGKIHQNSLSPNLSSQSKAPSVSHGRALAACGSNIPKQAVSMASALPIPPGLETLL
jgi:hypothetical protein